MSYFRAACHLNTFDEVVAHYNETKPLVSKLHTIQQDIRPIGARRRKWERIVKYSETEYGLTDGSYSDLYRTYNALEYTKNMVPILWQRREDGDYIRIRNYNKRHRGAGRIEFINTFGPRGIYLFAERGRTYVQRPEGDHYLPKTEYEYIFSAGKTTKDDGMCLWFKREGDTFVRANSITAPGTRIDKELKKELKPHLEKFLNWAMIMYPLITADETTYQTKWNEIREWMHANGHPEVQKYGALHEINSEALRDIIRNEEHPMRTPFMYLMFMGTNILHWSGSRCVFETSEDVKHFRSAFNSWTNKVLQLYELTVY